MRSEENHCGALNIIPADLRDTDLVDVLLHHQFLHRFCDPFLVLIVIVLTLDSYKIEFCNIFFLNFYSVCFANTVCHVQSNN